ncbi:hypothetical protein [Streptomyces sp. B6B3]|uniref:hypothetical protein n=1 Tax=Streptomyces sp. B6B3 TaxID=3153570 RepID=UPI00325F6F5C
MSADGLYYLPEGFQEGARANVSAADAAEATHQALASVQVNAASFGGADAFVNALITTRDTQARGVAMAAEGRQGMASADNAVAGIGTDMDAAAEQTLGGASAQTAAADQTIADGV